METIQDLGKTFVKATVLARKYRYTTDYIGQLCRKNKVEAKLVGRAWFVNEESLIHHKSDRYSSVRNTEIISNNKVIIQQNSISGVEKRQVRPVLKKTTHKIIKAGIVHDFSTNFASRISVYEEMGDNTNLLPVLKKPLNKTPFTDESHKIKINLEEKAKNKLVFEDLPQISLNGELDVVSLDDSVLFEDTEPLSRLPKNEPRHDEITKPVVTVTKRYQKPEIAKYESVKNQPKNNPDHVSKIPSSKISFAPNLVQKNVSSVGSKEVKSWPLFKVLFVSLIFGILVSFGLVGVSTVDVNVEGNISQKLVFDHKNFAEIFKKLPKSY